MSTNDNGFTVTFYNYTKLISESNHPSMSEGAIIGITFGWITGVAALYILGMCLIRIYYKRKGVSSDSDSAFRSKHRRPYMDQNPDGKPKETLGKRSQQMYQENVTLEMIATKEDDRKARDLYLSSE